MKLRKRWSKAWGKNPHAKISQDMLERSLHYKKHIEPSISNDVKIRLDKLVTDYKDNQNNLNGSAQALQPGMKLIRNWQGTDHTVTVLENGFEYKGQHYKSLSKIANDITGSRWNGWLFFV
jgi:acetylornithine/succinyldiaminopimelate/putrescine aminotransferase